MAKMAGLHAELSELPDRYKDLTDEQLQDAELFICEYCGDTTEICEDAGECPAGLR
jgi:rubrerythrin